MRVLVVDDDPGLRQSLALLLSEEGFEVAAEGKPSDGLARATSEPFDIVLCDVRMPGMDGIEFLRRHQAAGGRALVIMMSAYGGEDAAIAAMKEGAYDYLSKPFRPDEVVLTLRKAAERERLRGQVATLKAELARFGARTLVAESARMRVVLEQARLVAAHATTVLITGESGTGKEVLARTIHDESPRAERKFVAVNCAAIPESLLESELFGHVRGAFTGAVTDKIGLFEEAHAGSLLLDEIGELPAALQAKLLRVLQEGEIRRVGDTRNRKVDVRLIAATARDLEQDVRDGGFREDLYYRLNVVRLHIPPLRERPEDLEPLVTALLQRVMERSGRRVTIGADAMAAIRAHSWPGNIRQLENALERAVVLSANGSIGADAFQDSHPVAQESDETEPASGRLSEVVDSAEREAIRRALEASDGSRADAAKLLGVSVRSLFYKLKRLGL